MSPYKLHRHWVQLEGLGSHLIRGRTRNSKELRHPSDRAASVYGHHRIAVVNFNFATIHFAPFRVLPGFAPILFGLALLSLVLSGS
jgi:hypothetical protein